MVKELSCVVLFSMKNQIQTKGKKKSSLEIGLENSRLSATSRAQVKTLTPLRVPRALMGLQDT